MDEGNSVLIGDEAVMKSIVDDFKIMNWNLYSGVGDGICFK